MPDAERDAILMTLCLDVTDLEVSSAFYARLLGASVVRSDRHGMIFTQQLLTTPRMPGVALFLRQAFGKRVVGSQPGTLLRLGLRVSSMPALESLPDVKWIGPVPSPGSAEASAGPWKFLDPDGYEIEMHTGEISAL
jgi:catechol 2,3-dioxygenase-like lactoylglutathione lyase family enzyme